MSLWVKGMLLVNRHGQDLGQSSIDEAVIGREDTHPGKCVNCAEVLRIGRNTESKRLMIDPRKNNQLKVGFSKKKGNNGKRQ